MKRLLAALLFIAILAAACIVPDEAGENFNRNPYLVVLDADGNVIHEEYMSAEDYFGK